MRVFFDTNVFLYSVDDADPRKRKAALDLIESAVHYDEVFISGQVVAEFLNVALRPRRPFLSGERAESFVREVFSAFTICPLDTETAIQAIALSKRYGFSWFDSLIVATALAMRCELLYSEDFQDGLAVGALMIKNPFAGLVNEVGTQPGV